MRTGYISFMAYPILLLAGLSLGCGEPTGTPPLGTLLVTTSTSGSAPAGTGYSVRVDQNGRYVVPAEGRITIPGLTTGSHVVTLLDLPPRCAVSDGNPRAVDVAASATTEVLFAVTCGPPTGAVRVITSSFGEPHDPDGYELAINGVVLQAIAIADTVVVSDIPVGQTWLTLHGIAPNCASEVALPLPVQVNENWQTPVTIAVGCAPAPGTGGVIAVSVTSTLINIGTSPPSYRLTMDGGPAVGVPANGTASFSGVTPGDHSVRLDVPFYCAVGGFTPEPNPVLVSMPADGFRTVRFSVLCIG